MNAVVDDRRWPPCLGPVDRSGTAFGQCSAENDSMNALAERYVKLVLALGQHDADYVDAYYGPPEWQKDAEASKAHAGADRS